MARTTTSRICIVLALLVAEPFHTAGEDRPAENANDQAREIATALNHVTASLVRIRKYDHKWVAAQEQDKILNNLNRRKITEPEVISLYASILKEIGSVEIAEHDRNMIEAKYRKTLYRGMEANAFVALAQTATMSLDGIVRTGVRSWLDYRDLQWNRDNEDWKVEKTQMTAIVDNSAKLIETSWKLARAGNIPDHWLIREADLDDLEEATAEPDHETRLRMLTDMSHNMECYPPFDYQVAWTLQALGRFDEAADVYTALAEKAEGYFRQQHLVASALANLAIIQQWQGDPVAGDTALLAISKARKDWAVNLMCAQVLEAAGNYDDAERAILRNLDRKLEADNSTLALAGFYYRQDRDAQLAKWLAKPEFLARLPATSIVQCAAKLGPEQTPHNVLASLKTSLKVAVENRWVGDEDLVVGCHPIWRSDRVQSLALQLPYQPALAAQPASLRSPQRESLAGNGHTFRYQQVVRSGGRFQGTQSGTQLEGAVLRFEYPAADSRSEPSVMFVRVATARDQYSAAGGYQPLFPVEVRTGDAVVRLDSVPLPGDEKRVPAPQSDPTPQNVNREPQQRPAGPVQFNGFLGSLRDLPRAFITGVRPAESTPVNSNRSARRDGALSVLP